MCIGVYQYSTKLTFSGPILRGGMVFAGLAWEINIEVM
nr:MAG TPA: hypothetical protein [Bacteriophage sp.]